VFWRASACVRVRICACVWYACMCEYEFVRSCVHTCMPAVCVCRCVHACVSACMSLCVCVRPRTCVYARGCVRVCAGV
jgi:hypothetical protein